MFYVYLREVARGVQADCAVLAVGSDSMFRNMRGASTGTERKL